MMEPQSSETGITLINVFVVEPQHQQELVALLTQAAETLALDTPGFISSTLHRSLDGTKVAMYARWRSLEDYNAMRQNPAPRAFLTRALEIARFDPGVYEIVRTFTSQAEGARTGGASGADRG